MRVIAGSARHIALKTLSGMDTRPTTDRIKETLFNILQFQIPDATVLDLFSGSGAIGIEALSRGAKKAVFVEQNRAAIACIRENLEKTHLEPYAQVHASDVLTAIARMKGEEPFSFVFMDPPYQSRAELQALAALRRAELVDESSVIIIEALLETTFDEVAELGFQITRVKEYRTNKHVFLRLMEE